MGASARAWASLLALSGGFLLTGIAYAHADYARSEPGSGAVVAAAPEQVVIWFTQDMFRRQGANWIQVIGPNGDEVQTGEAVINDDDRRQLSVALQPDLPPGEYTVTWHTLSAEDGDDHDGSFTFTFDPQAPVTSTPMSAPATPTTLPATATTAAPVPTPTAAGSQNVGCGLALAPGLGLVLMAAALHKRQRRFR